MIHSSVSLTCTGALLRVSISSLICLWLWVRRIGRGSSRRRSWLSDSGFLLTISLNRCLFLIVRFSIFSPCAFVLISPCLLLTGWLSNPHFSARTLGQHLLTFTVSLNYQHIYFRHRSDMKNNSSAWIFTFLYLTSLDS